MDWIGQGNEYFAANYISGMEMAYPDRFKLLKGDINSASLIKSNPTFENVAVIISGGASNGPLMAGFAGEGLADAVVVGAPYAAPNAYSIYETGKYLGKNKGVLLLYNNFAGDYLNNDMAKELLELDGIKVESIAVTDDIASALDEPRENRGGRCGIGMLIKIAGCCSGMGMELEEIAKLVRNANERLGTLSVAVDFDERKIVYGNGFSGEPGFYTSTHMEMEKLAQEACDFLIDDLKPSKDEKLFVMVNRLRYTCYADSYNIARLFYDALSKKHNIMRMRVAAFSNILDVYGFNFSILCADAQLMNYLSGDVHTDAFIL